MHNFYGEFKQPVYHSDSQKLHTTMIIPSIMITGNIKKFSHVISSNTHFTKQSLEMKFSLKKSKWSVFTCIH